MSPERTSPERLFVVDTNVVVAGLLTARSDAPTARILDAMLTGALRFAVSIELLTGYRAVLLRSRIRSRHGLAAHEVDTVLEGLVRNAVVVNPPATPGEAPDSGDRHLWALLAALPEGFLVTGDEALRRGGAAGRVLSPAEAVTVL